MARYLRDRELQREINAGLNVAESWDAGSSVIYFGRAATSRPTGDEQELSVLCLRVLQAPSYSTELNAANLVYERVGDRLAWQIYRFRSGIVSPDRYRYGPYGRTHGLRHGEFLDPRERAFMLHPVLHVWSKAVTALTAETLLELFQEAVDLRPPDPRTGIW